MNYVLNKAVYNVLLFISLQTPGTIKTLATAFIDSLLTCPSCNIVIPFVQAFVN